MSYRYERRRRGNGCLLWLVVAVWALVLGIAGYRFILQPRISQYLGEQIGERLEGRPAPQPGQVDGEIVERAGGVLPTVVAALPSGELRVGEDRINQYLADHADSLGPVDSVAVRLVPGELQADIRALGTTSTAGVGLVAQDGRVVAVNPRMEGALGQLVSLAELTRALEDRLNDQLLAQGRRVTDVRIEQGEMIVRIE